MEIKKRHLVFLWKSNGPSSSQILEEVIETVDGYYFRGNSKSGFFQIREIVFKNSVADTAKLMPDLHVEYSQVREKK